MKVDINKTKLELLIVIDNNKQFNAMKRLLKFYRYKLKKRFEIFLNEKGETYENRKEILVKCTDELVLNELVNSLKDSIKEAEAKGLRFKLKLKYIDEGD